MGRCNRHAKHCTDCKSLSFVESPAHPTRKRRSPLFQSSPILKKVPSVSLALVSNNWVEPGFQDNIGAPVADNVANKKPNSPPKKNKGKRRMNSVNSTMKTNKKLANKRYSPLEFIPSGSTPPTDKESSPENGHHTTPNKISVAAMTMTTSRRVLTSTGSESSSLPENIQGISSINSIDCNILGQILQGGTPCQSWASTGEILVEDTPPRFYGFTIKQRQRLEMQKCKLGT